MTRVGSEGWMRWGFFVFFFFPGLGHRADGNVLSGLIGEER